MEKTSSFYLYVASEKSKAGKLEKVNEMIKSWKKQLGNDEKV